MKYLVDQIGDEYLEWDNHYVLISTPTGSGKTTFILKKLLPRAVAANKYILYICNRRFLRSQFETLSLQALCDIYGRDINSSIVGMGLTPEEEGRVIVTSYQHFEKAGHRDAFYLPVDLSKYSKDELNWMKGNNRYPISQKIPYDDIMYFIYDEAHYFFTDSLFNQDCNFWFDQIGCYPINFPGTPVGTHIFLTATPEPFKIFLAGHYLSPSYKLGYTKEMHLKDICQTIYDGYDAKYKLLNNAKVPQKTLCVNWGHKADKKYEYPEHMESILQEWEKKSPCNEIVSQLRPYLNELPIIEWKSQEPSRYKEMPITYFDTLESLIPHIIKSQKDTACNSLHPKWLIFVDNEMDGMELSSCLTGLQVDSVFLSSKTMASKKRAKEEFQNISRHNAFRCTVLVSTSVMDCGVSIHDPDLKHVVISHSDRFTFLQMLGRKRLDSLESVHLYVRAYYLPGIIRRKRAFEDKIRFLCGYSLMDDETCKAVYKGSEPRYSNSYIKQPRYSSDYKKRVIEEMVRDYSRLLYYHPQFHESTAHSNEYLSDYELGKSAFLYMIYLVSEYTDVIERAHEEADALEQSVNPARFSEQQNNSIQKSQKLYHAPIDPMFYLKYQLSWIGQNYNVENWINYKETIEQICSYLESMIEKKKLKNDDEKDQFCQACIQILAVFPIPGKHLKRALSSYRNSGVLPQMTALNNIFKELNIPYKIESKQVCKNYIRYSVWIIHHM